MKPVEAAGERAKRAVEVALDAEPAADDRPRDVFGDGDLGTG